MHERLVEQSDIPFIPYRSILPAWCVDPPCFT